MALQIQGNGGSVLEVETNTRAARFTPRPIDVGALGSYSVASITGTMAAGLAAGSPIFSCRWSTANLMLLRKVTVSLSSLGTGFTAGVGILDMIVARTWTASDTGGTPIVLTGTNTNKRRTSFGASTIGDLRIASTATLTTGTRTLDTNPMSNLMFGVSTALNTVMLPSSTGLWMPDVSAEWPLVFATNEGFIIRATVPATGTWQAQVGIEWAEVASF